MDKTLMKSIATKVSPEAYARIISICNMRGITTYNMLQMMCDVIIRYMDDQHNLSDEINKIIRLFEGLENWNKRFTLTEPTDDMEVTGAIYLLREKNRIGEGMVYVSAPVLGQTFENFNVQSIIEMVIEIARPKLYKHLRMLGVELNTNSVLETIDKIVDMYRENPDDTELRIQFENNDWGENAKKPASSPYKRKVNHTMDEFEQEDMYLFTSLPGDEQEQDI